MHHNHDHNFLSIISIAVTFLLGFSFDEPAIPGLPAQQHPKHHDMLDIITGLVGDINSMSSGKMFDASPSGVDVTDRYKNISQIIQENGFEFEEHQVTTHDNYNLTLHRIPPKNKTADAPVVLLQHGIEDCSAQWVMNSVDKAAAFVFARAGFDVWLGNNRGNHFSRPTDEHYLGPLYWDRVDFEYMGTFDQPANIDYILEVTKDTNVIGKLAAYVGHSQGTTQFFIGASMLPDYYQQKVNLFVALAPIVRLEHTTNGGMKFGAELAGPVSWLVQEIGLYDLIDMPYWAKDLMMNFCSLIPHVCLAVEEGFFDWDNKIENINRLGVHEMHQPAGAGWKQLVHYGQIIKDKRFQRYDFGAEGNQKAYNQKQPPLYPLEDMTVPMIIHQGSLDMLADETDVNWLLNDSPLNKTLIIDHKMHEFGHNTFFMGMDASYLTDNVIVHILERMSI